MAKKMIRIISNHYIYKYFRRFINRIYAIFFVAIVLISCASPAFAVTPQQGWYIVGDVTYAGESYWVIAPKKDSTIGYTGLQGTLTRFTDTIIDSPFITSGGGSMDDNVVRWMYSSASQLEFYSDVPWFVDADWRVWVGTNGITANYGSFIYFIDRSLLPTWSFQSDNGLSVISNNPRLFPTSKSAILMGGIPISPNTYTVYKLNTYTDAYLGFLPFYEMGQSARTFPSRININDLIVAVSPSPSAMDISGVADHLPVTATVQLDVRFWCPKNKAPAACEVGMSWPYVPTTTVNAIEHFDPWKEELQKGSQISAPSQILPTLDNLNEGLTNAENVPSEAQAGFSVLTGMVGGFPLFGYLVPLFIAAIILPIMVKKGMS